MRACSIPAFFRRCALFGCLMLFSVVYVESVVADDETQVIQEQSIDGEEFFRSLVQRYRKLVHYVEKTLVEEVF